MMFFHCKFEPLASYLGLRIEETDRLWKAVNGHTLGTRINVKALNVFQKQAISSAMQQIAEPGEDIDMLSNSAGIRAGKYLIIPTLPARLIAFAIRHFPRLVRSLGDRSITRAQRSHS